MKILELPQALKERRHHGASDDFYHYTDGQLWTKLAADAGSSVAASASAPGGAVVLATGATDNNECAVATTNKPFKTADRKPLLFEARLQFSEANTDDANVFAGFSSLLNQANMLVDNGGGPAASFDGAGIYKIDGETAWRCVASRGAAQSITPSSRAAGGPAQQVLRVEIQPVTATDAEVTYFVDDEPLKDAAGNVIKHALAFAGAGAMQAGVCVKAGGANSEVVNVDRLDAWQLR